MAIARWVEKAKRERSNNLHYENYIFEKAHGILPVKVISLFDRWLRSRPHDDEGAQDLLDQFVRDHGYVQFAGPSVVVTLFGQHLCCTKSWATARECFFSHVVPTRRGNGSSIQAKIKTLVRNMNTLAAGGNDNTASVTKEWEAFETAVRTELKPSPLGAGPAKGSPPPKPPSLRSGAVEHAFVVVPPPSSTATPSVADPPIEQKTTERLNVTWVAPYDALSEKLGDDLRLPTQARSDLLAKTINILGLLPAFEYPWDARMLFTLDADAFAHDEVRRPTLFAGGFPQCYASANHDDNWGRTARLDDGGDHACTEGVPEAVCRGDALSRASDVHFIGFFTRPDYERAGCANPRLISEKRFDSMAEDA